LLLKISLSEIKNIEKVFYMGPIGKPPANDLFEKSPTASFVLGALQTK